jgi:hypothetical protein
MFSRRIGEERFAQKDTHKQTNVATRKSKVESHEGRCEHTTEDVFE